MARVCGLASQTISRLITARVPVTQTISTKNQMGRASQLCTRNQIFERDFFDMGYAVSMAKFRGKSPAVSERDA
ncbi:hypothetical protein PRtIB026_A35530 [Pseudomonas sp. RtIB026]|nr:hypothetical protein PRtIB026_A35530 [Pseudomonas sp. RtIB026]